MGKFRGRSRSRAREKKKSRSRAREKKKKKDRFRSPDVLKEVLGEHSRSDSGSDSRGKKGSMLTKRPNENLSEAITSSTHTAALHRGPAGSSLSMGLIPQKISSDLKEPLNLVNLPVES